ncbi:hypothetical protein GVN16_18200 [Emticicia sp. CRIBPO]|uniref:hypothetical protein n=1 Tax=Emticicia sp. CRIBPO TaxID=2683258 RepID=UPI001411E8D7|nr:hypothetical protein [Emticicia sp. CRIBPO]NBA87707.1 hypothetical protein [Emticicia sp. CRIBPO]
MNVYFLVEGRRTEVKVYPKWLSILVPELKKVQWHHQVSANNYCIFTGEGFPCLLNNHLKNSIQDVNESGNFDYLIICLDSDDYTVEEKKNQVLDFIDNENIILNSKTKLEIIVQNKCFETWFLGNTKVFKQNPKSTFLAKCVRHFNVRNEDPELMDKPASFAGSTAVFHSKYLQEIFEERKMNYTKRNPQVVAEEYFLNELIKRNKKTNHIQTFKYFIDFCRTISQGLQN